MRESNSSASSNQFAISKTTGEPWQYIGVSRSSWYRIMSTGQAPLPLDLPGRNPWRISDLDAMLAKCRQVRQLRRVPEHVLQAAHAARRRKTPPTADDQPVAAE